MNQLKGILSGESSIKGFLSIPSILKEGNVFTSTTYFEFPNTGNLNTVYIATNENAVYRWDENLGKYFCIGRDYTEINNINGGKA